MASSANITGRSVVFSDQPAVISESAPATALAIGLNLTKWHSTNGLLEANKFNEHPASSSSLPPPATASSSLSLANGSSGNLSHDELLASFAPFFDAASTSAS